MRLIEKLSVWEELELFTGGTEQRRSLSEKAESYAVRCYEEGLFHADGAEYDELIEGLVRAAQYYLYALGCEQNIKTNPELVKDPMFELSEEEQEGTLKRLKTPGRHQPKKYGNHAIILAMAPIAEHFGLTIGTTEKVDSSNLERVYSPFQRFVRGWLEIVDPDRKLPERKTFRVAKRKWKAATD